MDTFKLTKSVAFIFFNRPDVTARVFEAIRLARPPKLFLISDGPRINRPDDGQKCAQARKIVEKIDWPCEVVKNYSDTNLGCKMRVSSGISWVFEQVADAIILEDDCLPQPSFFRFCEEMLDHYQDDQRIMMISGDNFDPPHAHQKDSYYFVRRAHIWGWATWRRSWKHYDVHMKLWPEFRDAGGIESALAGLKGARYWKKAFNKTYAGKIDTWDHQWSLTLMMQRGLSIHPSKNLVTNLGFTPEGTHTKVKTEFSEMKSFDIEFPLTHPKTVFSNLESELRLQKKSQNIAKRVLTKLKGLIIP